MRRAWRRAFPLAGCIAGCKQLHRPYVRRGPVLHVDTSLVASYIGFFFFINTRRPHPQYFHKYSPASFFKNVLYLFYNVTHYFLITLALIIISHVGEEDLPLFGA